MTPVFIFLGLCAAAGLWAWFYDTQIGIRAGGYQEVPETLITVKPNNGGMYYANFSASSRYINRREAVIEGKRLLRVLEDDFWVRVGEAKTPVITTQIDNEMDTADMGLVDLLIYHVRFDQFRNNGHDFTYGDMFRERSVILPICIHMRLMPVRLRSKIHNALVETFGFTDEELAYAWNV